MPFTSSITKEWLAGETDHGMATMDSPFRFFDLPRELRDKIYSELTFDRHFEPKIGYDHLRPAFELTAFRLPHPRLVCKQMQQEYDDEVLRSAVFIINVSSAIQTWSVLQADLQKPATETIKLVSVVRKVTLRSEACFVGSDKELFYPGHFKLIQDAVDKVRAFANEVANDMISRSLLRVELTLDVHWGVVLAEEKWDTQSFFGMGPTPNARPDVQLSAHLFIEHSLFTAHDELQVKTGLAQYMHSTCDNWIIYEAKPCRYAGGWQCLDLTTHTCGVWDYESLLERALQRRSDDVWSDDGSLEGDGESEGEQSVDYEAYCEDEIYGSGDEDDEQYEDDEEGGDW